MVLTLFFVCRANYVTAIDGTFFLVYGTSASSPVVGSIITLINDARLFEGKSPVGFINPVLARITLVSPVFIHHENISERIFIFCSINIPRF